MSSKIADRYIYNTFYQMFLLDFVLYFYLAVTAGILIFWLRTGYEFSWHTWLYFGMIFLGSVIVYYIQGRRMKGKIKLININQVQIILLILQAVGIIVLFFMFNKTGGTKNQFFEEFLIAGWEQMTFISLTCVILLIIGFPRMKGQKEIPVFMLGIIGSSLVFAFAHWRIYGGELTTIGQLFGMGLIYIFIGYSFSPSLSWLLHLFNNVLLIIRS